MSTNEAILRYHFAPKMKHCDGFFQIIGKPPSYRVITTYKSLQTGLAAAQHRATRSQRPIKVTIDYGDGSGQRFTLQPNKRKKK